MITRKQMIQALVDEVHVDEVHALSDEDIDMLNLRGYDVVHVSIRDHHGICNLGEALYNVDAETKSVPFGADIPPSTNKVRRDRAWSERLQKLRGKS